ncbi:MAG TPA: ClpXP adapter SpxH family protein [Bacillales bacterium]|nr:ClpXP adapter SpxH family protein [Bacillales bacterium]
MTLYETGSYCDGMSGECHTYSSSQSSRAPGRNKPIELYVFIEPTCPICWALEPIIKKLVIEYGQYLKLRYLIGGRLNTFSTGDTNTTEQKNARQKADRCEKVSRRYGMPCNGDVWLENLISSPYNAAIAVKAAELQGKQAGLRFLRKAREAFFLKKENITEEEILVQCAELANLDVEEFRRDIHADSAVKAFQCDMKITSEMEVDHLPTLVFLNANEEESGIKISGNYPYEAYQQVICEMLGRQPQTAEPPAIEAFLKKYPFVATKEIAVVYDLSCEEVEREMKKLQLKQKVERIPVKYGTFWRYSAPSTKTGDSTPS